MNICNATKTTSLIVVLLALNLGLSAAVFGQRLEARFGEEKEIAPVATEPAEENATQPDDTSGDAKAVSSKTVFSGKDALTFVHECQGEVKTSVPVPGGMFKDATAQYCVGKNVLSMKDSGGAEIAKMSETVSTSAEDAPILESVTWVPGHAGRKTVSRVGTVLVAYGVAPCSISEDGCGAGMVSNLVTYGVDVATKEVRTLHYASRGTPVWNDAGTKAIFPVVQVGGAGCEDRPISGYDLTTDTWKVLTTEAACEFSGGPGTDVEGNPLPSWGPTFWTSNDTFTTEILGVDGKWRQIDGTF